MKLSLILTSFLFVSHAIAIDEPWRPLSDPAIMSPTAIRYFNALPLEGRATGENRFWSGDYWALEKGNINLRWNSRRQRGFKLESPRREAVMVMSKGELSELAPSEKLDVLMGRYTYPLVAQVSQIANKRADEWEGICHGWAPAAVNHNEPLPKELVSVDGVVVPFGSSDIKALVSFYYAHGFKAEDTYQTGSRCFKNNTRRNDGCKEDLNAGAFHIILANRLAIEGKAFVADLDRGEEVWNHPVFAFTSVIEKDNIRPDRNSALGTVKMMRIRTEILYTNETLNFWEPVMGTPDQIVDKKKYEYELDISADGQILGGKWRSSERPDFLWVQNPPAQFEGLFTRLPELLND